MDAYTEQTLIHIGVGVVLTFLLRQLFLKLRPEPFLAYWSLYWCAFSVYLGIALLYLRTPPPLAGWRGLLNAAGLFLWVFQPVLMLLAGMALGARRPSRRTEIRILTACIGGAAVAAIALFATGTPIASVPLLSPLRFLVHAGTLTYFVWAFARSGPRVQAIGGRVTVLCCGGYALHMLAHSLSLFGVPIYSGLTSPNAAVVATLLPLGMAAGVVLSVIEEARTATQEARESDRRFRALLEDIRMAALMLDREGRVTFCNDHLVRILGWKREEIVGRNWFDEFVPEHVREWTKQQFSEFMAVGTYPPQHENFVLTRDGRQRLMQWSNTPLTDKAGRMAGTSSLGHDLTEQRQMEESFRQAQKMESVGRLAGGVAHDFNNHLTVINGYCDMVLARLSETDRNREMVREVRSAGDRASALTRQLLAFSRKQVLTPVPLSCNDVVSGTLGMFRRLVREEIAVREVLAEDLGTVLADPGQLEQVLMNLVVNANDAIEGAGTITISTANANLDEAWVETHPDATAGEYVMLAVGDTGHGMDEATRRQIFEPFFTTKSVHKGTGLGLAMVYGIVRQSDGTIVASSEKGKGSLFQVFLPRVYSPAVGALPEDREVEDLQGDETILVVEDHAQLRRMAVDVLAASGYEVLEAESGADAIRLLKGRSEAPGLLISDIMMPGMSGVELARRLYTTWPELKVLYISGYTDGALGAQASAGLATEFLPKPFTPVQLLRRVREILQ